MGKLSSRKYKVNYMQFIYLRKEILSAQTGLGPFIGKDQKGIGNRRHRHNRGDKNV